MFLHVVGLLEWLSKNLLSKQIQITYIEKTINQVCKNIYPFIL
jgi:hypothetical protein